VVNARIELRHLDGFQGWRGRRAWRRLVRHGDRGDAAAIDTMWRLWLRKPDDEPWEHLCRWLPEPAERVFAAVVDPGTPAPTRSLLGEFCTAHEMAPADPVDKALFFVLTGKFDRHRALDPDSALLATAYRAATPASRAAVRQAMVGAGDVDFVRVIVADRDKDPTDEEIAYFTRQFIRAGAWRDLWRLVRDLPVWHAVAAMPSFGDWRPRGDRELFDRLAAAQVPVTGRQAVLDLVNELRRVRTLSNPRLFPVRCASFSPDGLEIAIASVTAGVRVFRLPGLWLIDRLSPRVVPGAVLHLGESMITVETGPDRRHRLVRHRAGRATNLWEGVDWFDDILATAGLGGRYLVAKRGELLHGSGASPVRRVPFGQPLSLATDPAGGRIAVGRSRELGLSILDESLETIASVRFPGVSAGRVHDVAFTGTDRLVSVDKGGRLRLWERDGHTLRVLVEGHVPAHAWPQWAGVRGGLRTATLHAFPLVGRIAVAGRGQVAWLDAHTLAEADPPPGLPVAGEWDIWSSPDGSRVMVANDRTIVVVDLLARAVAEMLTKPLAKLGSADLVVVSAAIAQRDLGPEVGQLLELALARLEYRFATEISLGDTTAIRPAGDDIALGGGTPW
jgi:hypothetical protein